MAFKKIDEYSEFDCELFDDVTLDEVSCYLNITSYVAPIDDNIFPIPNKFDPYLFECDIE